MIIDFGVFKLTLESLIFLCVFIDFINRLKKKKPNISNQGKGRYATESRKKKKEKVFLDK